MSVLDDINEYNYTNLRPLEEIDSACYDSDMNSYHYKIYMDTTPINLKNDTKYSYHNHHVNFVRNFYANLLYYTNREDVLAVT